MIRTFTLSPTPQPTINVYLNEKKAVSESKFKKMHPEEVKKLITGRCHQADLQSTDGTSPIKLGHLPSFHQQSEKRNIDGGNDTPLPTGQDQDRYRDEGHPRPLSGLVINIFFLRSFAFYRSWLGLWTKQSDTELQNSRYLAIWNLTFFCLATAKAETARPLNTRSL